MESLLHRIDCAMMGAAQPGVETIDEMRAKLARNATEQSRVRRELDAHKNRIWQVERIAQLEQELADLRNAAPRDGGADARTRVAELTAASEALAVKDRELKNAIAEEERKQRELAELAKRKQRELAENEANTKALIQHVNESDDTILRRIQSLNEAISNDSQEEGYMPNNSSYDTRRAEIQKNYLARTSEINELRRVQTARAKIAKLDAELKILNAELTRLFQRGEPTATTQSVVYQKLMEKRMLETGR
jgi:DNA repair exonuclease SbcCD ATPase subunit